MSELIKLVIIIGGLSAQQTNTHTHTRMIYPKLSLRT